MPTIHAECDEETHAKLREIADAQGTSIAKVVLSAVAGVAHGTLVPREEPLFREVPPLWRPKMDVRPMTPEERAERDR